MSIRSRRSAFPGSVASSSAAPVRPFQVLALLDVALRQFGQHVAQFVHAAAATISVWPELLDRRDQARRAVADHQPRAAQSAASEVATEVEPVLARLARTETNRQPHAFAAERIAQATNMPSLLPLGRVGRYTASMNSAINSTSAKLLAQNAT